MTTGSRGAAASGAAVSVAASGVGGLLSGGLGHIFRGFCHFFGRVGRFGHWATCLISYGIGLLGGVRMLRPDVDLQLLLDLMAELGVRDHAEDRLLDDPVGVLLHLVTECARPQTAGITRVAVGHLLRAACRR